MQQSYFHLHPAQQDVYTDQLLNSNSPRYNIGGYIRLKGPLQKEIFYKAVQSAPAVFDAFQMRFDLEAADFICQLQENLQPPAVGEIDLSSFANPEEKAKEWMQERFNIPFSIKKENPLYEQFLIKIKEDEHWFFGKYHHLITDGYGFIVYVQYLAHKYKLLAAGQNLPISFPSYQQEAVKAVEYTKSAAYEEEGKYWKEKITAKPEKLLSKKYAQSGSGRKSATYVLKLSIQQSKLLEEIQAVTGHRLLPLTTAALLIYFGKTSGQSHFIFGIPVHKRATRQLRNVMGMFSGILPFSCHFHPEKTLAGLLKDIAHNQKNDFLHQNYTLGDIIRNLKGNPTAAEVCEVILNYEPFHFQLDFGPAIQASIYQLTSEYGRNPLEFCWQNYGDQQPLQLLINYWTEYYNEEEIALVAQRILYILEQFPSRLNTAVSGIAVVPEKEQQLLLQFNHAQVDYPRNKTVVDLFEEQAEKTPHHTAVAFEGRKLTYKELNERSNQLAWYLKGKGVKEETPVPICMERSQEMIVSIFGILKAGGAYVPIDPEYPQERISYMLQDTGAAVIITSNEAQTKLPVAENMLLIALDQENPEIKAQPETNLPNKIKPKQLAYVIYTSGSTGKPKGVMIEHQALLDHCFGMIKSANLASCSSFAIFSPLVFDAGHSIIHSALLLGASLHIISDRLLTDSDQLVNYLNANAIDCLKIVPSLWLSYTEGTIVPLARKVMVFGGEPFALSILERFRQINYKGEVYNHYGPTETTIGKCIYKVNLNKPYHTVPIGKPFSNTQVYIVDPLHQLVPIGTAGELYIGGEGIARGYLNRFDLTAEKFIPDFFSKKEGARVYRTGDLCRWLPDGNIEYLGRIDDQVKIRGFRIELGEIESVLQQSRLIKQGVVLAKEDNKGAKRLIGYIVPEGTLNREALVAYTKAMLPEYMVPALWVELGALPVTVNGKVDKKALPAPDAAEWSNGEYVPPRNQMEETLVALWQELLGVERIGINDNFFDLGGHSLKAIQLTSRLHKQFNKKITIGEVIANPTIRQLSQLVGLEQKDQFHQIKPIPLKEHYALAHAQKRIWILSQFKDGSLAYSGPGGYEIKGVLNIAAFKKTFELLIERHENLRTIFIEVDNEPRQKILSSSQIGFRMDEFDVRAHPDGEAVIQQWLQKDRTLAFDLTKAPLFRAALFRKEDQTHILSFNIHHIISDGWSRGIFIREFLQVYKGLADGASSELPPLAIQYKDYAAWQSGSFTAQGSFWRDVYEKDVPVLDFPVDFERPKVLSFSGAVLQQTIPEDLTLSLQKMAAAHNLTLNNLVLALYGLLVSYHSRQDDLVVGSLTSGRSHFDLENLIGVFINFLPIRLFPKKHLTLAEYLTNTSHFLAKAYSNQDYPFDLMVDNFIRQRDVSRNPFFDTMVNFHSELNIHNEVQLQDDPRANTGIVIKQLPLSEKEAFQSVLDFKLDVEPVNQMLNLKLSYNTKLFRSDRMSTLLTQFIELLQKAAEDSNKQLAEYTQWPVEKGYTVEKEVDSSPVRPVLPVHICASFVIEPVQDYIAYWSKEYELNTEVVFAPYNQVFQQLLNPQSILNSGKGINVLFIRIDDWLRDQNHLSPAEQITLLDKTYADLILAIEEAHKKTFIPYLIGIVPLYHPHNFSVEVAQHIEIVNEKLEQSFKKQPFITILDLSEVASLYEIEEVYDKLSDKMGHMPFAPEFYAALGTYISRKIRAFKGPSYKVIALDCDNTLWKGICGEVGTDGVVIDENFTYLQKFLLRKHQEGFLLVLCSKNNEEDVWEVFQRNDMQIRREHISASAINWKPKPDNLKALATELNLGTDSFIFLDDSDFEIEQMILSCPDVLSLALPEDSNEIAGFLNHNWAFDTFRVTEEDRQRNAMYKAEKSRKEEQGKHSSFDAFLQSLDITVTIRELEEKDLDRAVQLSLRTNQFNLNGIRKSREEIAKSLYQQNTVNRIIEVKDRFGDYGIVGLLLAKAVANTLILETFLLSCRVLGREVEKTVLEHLKNYCVVHELDSIKALYQPTSKNKPFSEFLTHTDWIADKENAAYNFLINYSDQELLCK